MNGRRNRAPRAEQPGELLQPFRDAFTAPTWEHVLVLVMGTILVPGRRTVASALRVMGLGQARHFTNYHRVLNRNAWSAHALSRRLLVRLVDAFVPDGEPVVIGPDDTIERRWGTRIKKRGIYRDPVRSSKGHFVKASGLRWLSYAAARDPLGRALLGFAVPGHPGAVTAVLGDAQSGPAPVQGANRQGQAGAAPDGALAAAPAHCRRRRCQLRCH